MQIEIFPGRLSSPGLLPTYVRTGAANKRTCVCMYVHRENCTGCRQSGITAASLAMQAHPFAAQAQQARRDFPCAQLTGPRWVVHWGSHQRRGCSSEVGGAHVCCVGRGICAAYVRRSRIGCSVCAPYLYVRIPCRFSCTQYVTEQPTRCVVGVRQVWTLRVYVRSVALPSPVACPTALCTWV